MSRKKVEEILQPYGAGERFEAWKQIACFATWHDLSDDDYLELIHGLDNGSRDMRRWSRASTDTRALNLLRWMQETFDPTKAKSDSRWDEDDDDGNQELVDELIRRGAGFLFDELAGIKQADFGEGYKKFAAREERKAMSRRAEIRKSQAENEPADARELNTPADFDWRDGLSEEAVRGLDAIWADFTPEKAAEANAAFGVKP